MSVGNVSFIKDFVIVGFPGLQPHYYGLVSAHLFFVYVFTLVGNALFFMLFVTTKSLQKPVYYFIINLVVCDVLFSTTTLPKIISRYWFQDGTISFLGCFVQMFFVHYFGSVCSVILAVIAIDRYAAICYPLQYHSIMTNQNVLILFFGSWILGLVGPMAMVIRAYPLPYCAENTIIHCYCDHVSITTLACIDRSLYSIPALIYAFAILLVPFAVIIFSYCSIFLAVMQISGTQGKMKTFSTCSPQLIIIKCFKNYKSNIIYTPLYLCLLFFFFKEDKSIAVLLHLVYFFCKCKDLEVRELHDNFVTVPGGTMSFASQAIVFIICQI
uniref:Olfactory receptor n=1 Tax=Sinocyclocheilus grahami TaxID=75366 RepID=A0A672ME37_SINGR